jgi:hypothetical protein
MKLPRRQFLHWPQGAVIVQMADAVKTAEWTVPTKGAPFPPGGPAPL